MAADWIPMRLDLDEDPAILEMADELNLGIWDVIGRCWRVWVWASRNCHAESVTGVTLHRLDMVTHVGEDFLQALQRTGWMEVFEQDGRPAVRWPNWDRWLSQSAKQRSLATIRKRRQREKNGSKDVTEMSRSERDKSVTTEYRIQKKEKKKKPPTPFRPEEVETLLRTDPRFLPAWSDFCQHRKEIKKPLTPQATKGAIACLEEIGIDRAIDALRHTIANGWQGIREPDHNGRAPQSRREMTVEELDAASEALRK
jgi:hypothetical protein